MRYKAKSLRTIRGMKRLLFLAAILVTSFGLSASLQALAATLPSGTAVFETSLQSRITSTDSTLTLVANSVRGGGTLSGYQCFTVDEGRTDAEYLCGTVSGTSVTSLTRGIDPLTGTSSNSSLKFAHRVGANVKITDFPLLQILRNQAGGRDTYSNVLTYANGVTPASTGDLTDKEYVDGIAFNGAGVIDASAIARGVVELATGAEAASSATNGSSGVLALPASLATSTWNSATAANRVIVTDGTGKVDNNSSRRRHYFLHRYSAQARPSSPARRSTRQRPLARGPSQQISSS